jgi:hypothetical protein
MHPGWLLVALSGTAGLVFLILMWRAARPKVDARPRPAGLRAPR